MNPLHQPLEVTRFINGAAAKASGDYPLEHETWLSVNGENWLGFRCSPEDLENLGIGFLYNESIIENMGEVASVRVCENLESIDIWLNHAAQKPASWSRTSGCQGGMSTSFAKELPAIPSTYQVNLADLQSWIHEFLQKLASGELPDEGLHTTGLFVDGLLVMVYRDIGRHNTLDKIAGECLLRNISLQNSLLITTGRISSEMVTKSMRMGIPILASLHSASVPARDLAEKAGIMLVSHARKPQFAILTHIERLMVD